MPKGFKAGGRQSEEGGARENYTLRLSPTLRQECEYWASIDGIPMAEWIHRQIANAVNDRQRDAYLEHLERCE